VVCGQSKKLEDLNYEPNGDPLHPFGDCFCDGDCTDITRAAKYTQKCRRIEKKNRVHLASGILEIARQQNPLYELPEILKAKTF
jgi:hypothetical protein